MYTKYSMYCTCAVVHMQMHAQYNNMCNVHVCICTMWVHNIAASLLLTLHGIMHVLHRHDFYITYITYL